MSGPGFLVARNRVRVTRRHVHTWGTPGDPCRWNAFHENQSQRGGSPERENLLTAWPGIGDVGGLLTLAHRVLSPSWGCIQLHAAYIVAHRTTDPLHTHTKARRLTGCLSRTFLSRRPETRKIPRRWGNGARKDSNGELLVLIVRLEAKKSPGRRQARTVRGMWNILSR